MNKVWHNGTLDDPRFVQYQTNSKKANNFQKTETRTISEKRTSDFNMEQSSIYPNPYLRNLLHASFNMQPQKVYW